MIILAVLIAAIALALLRGGNLGNLATVNLRWRGVIILGFLIQVLIFSSFWQDRRETLALTQFFYLASLCLLVAALAANRHIPGMMLITFGFLLNFIAIAANGGYMPALYSAMQNTTFSPLLPGQVSTNSIGMGPDTRLPFLGDIFAIPRGIPFSNVFSLGDVLIALGTVYLIQRVLVVSPPRTLPR
jgi:lipoprotein signal peptidase